MELDDLVLTIKGHIISPETILEVAATTFYEDLDRDSKPFTVFEDQPTHVQDQYFHETTRILNSLVKILYKDWEAV